MGRKEYLLLTFYCHEHKLAVELDGVIHQKQKEYDAMRTFIVNHLGFRVIRFTNDEVRFEADKVIAILKNNLTR